MQNFSNFEKSLEGATSVSNFVHKVNEILEIKMFPAILSHLWSTLNYPNDRCARYAISLCKTTGFQKNQVHYHL